MRRSVKAEEGSCVIAFRFFLLLHDAESKPRVNVALICRALLRAGHFKRPYRKSRGANAFPRSGAASIVLKAPLANCKPGLCAFPHDGEIVPDFILNHHPRIGRGFLCFLVCCQSIVVFRCEYP